MNATDVIDPLSGQAANGQYLVFLLFQLLEVLVFDYPMYNCFMNLMLLKLKPGVEQTK